MKSAIYLTSLPLLLGSCDCYPQSRIQSTSMRQSLPRQLLIQGILQAQFLNIVLNAIQQYNIAFSYLNSHMTRKMARALDNKC